MALQLQLVQRSIIDSTLHSEALHFIFGDTVYKNPFLTVGI
jgi:hypothetical protein